MSGATMGQLRSLLHSPSSANFHAIIRLLESWPDEDNFRQQALPYAHRMLENWPEEIERAMDSHHDYAQVLFGTCEDSQKMRRRASLLCLFSTISVYRSFFYDFYDERVPWPEVMEPCPAFLTRHLSLKEGTFEGAFAWLSERHFPRLRSLELGLRVSDEDALYESLVAASWWEQLEHLGLHLSNDLVALVMYEVSLPNLQSLNPGLEGSCRAEGLRALLDAIGPGHLKSVDCQEAWLPREAAEVLATHPAMASVLHLDMRYNRAIGPAGAQMLLDSEVLSEEARRSVSSHYDDIFE